jgi:hypothetical protein
MNLSDREVAELREWYDTIAPLCNGIPTDAVVQPFVRGIRVCRHKDAQRIASIVPENTQTLEELMMVLESDSKTNPCALYLHGIILNCLENPIGRLKIVAAASLNYGPALFGDYLINRNRDSLKKAAEQCDRGALYFVGFKAAKQDSYIAGSSATIIG